jgi:hypothetical protein
VVAPMPSAGVISAAAAKPALRHIVRIASAGPGTVDFGASDAIVDIVSAFRKLFHEIDQGCIQN